MKRLSKDDITAALARQRALPLFNCGDAATGMQVLEALHAGGIRFAEFTNRAAGALDVFRGLVAEAAQKLPDMVLGAGTIIDAARFSWRRTSTRRSEPKDRSANGTSASVGRAGRIMRSIRRS
jgi:2-keto-3-deoxy-6-phosphogluconate aldolase